jgi:sugar (pentulose or hexulose) kinase
VGMVHCNNCTSDLNAWVNLFQEYGEAMGLKADKNDIFATLYHKALEGDADCGGLLSYCYLSGEPITNFEQGRPLFARMADSKFNLSNFMRTHLYSSLSTLKIGLDILFKQEGVTLDNLMGHGGLFKTKGVGQKIMAAAASVPVSVMETAGEGGAWGIAVLADYMKQKQNGETLEQYLNNKVFANSEAVTIVPSQKDSEGFDKFIELYQKCLPIEKVAVETMK